jgi:hypothetical protein
MPRAADARTAQTIGWCDPALFSSVLVQAYHWPGQRLNQMNLLLLKPLSAQESLAFGTQNDPCLRSLTQ